MVFQLSGGVDRFPFSIYGIQVEDYNHLSLLRFHETCHSSDTESLYRVIFYSGDISCFERVVQYANIISSETTICSPINKRVLLGAACVRI